MGKNRNVDWRTTPDGTGYVGWVSTDSIKLKKQAVEQVTSYLHLKWAQEAYEFRIGPTEDPKLRGYIGIIQAAVVEINNYFQYLLGHKTNPSPYPDWVACCADKLKKKRPQKVTE
jgi:hypothetical protein